MSQCSVNACTLRKVAEKKRLDQAAPSLCKSTISFLGPLHHLGANIVLSILYVFHNRIDYEILIKSKNYICGQVNDNHYEQEIIILTSKVNPFA